jgi:hypothetical protein
LEQTAFSERIDPHSLSDAFFWLRLYDAAALALFFQFLYCTCFLAPTATPHDKYVCQSSRNLQSARRRKKLALQSRFNCSKLATKRFRFRFSAYTSSDCYVAGTYRHSHHAFSTLDW